MNTQVKMRKMSPENFVFEGTDGNKYIYNPYASNDQPEFVDYSSIGEDIKVYIKNEYNVELDEFTCPECNASFQTFEECKLHSTEAHNTKKYVCPICSRSFKRNDHLKRHVKSIHTEQSSDNQCVTCGKIFARRSFLLRHIEMRHGVLDRRYPCSECTEDFQGLEELLAHERNVHGGVRHRCTHCMSTFKRRDHMLRHIKTAHLLETIACPFCPALYKRKDHLTRHVREKHTDLNGENSLLQVTGLEVSAPSPSVPLDSSPSLPQPKVKKQKRAGLALPASIANGLTITPVQGKNVLTKETLPLLLKEKAPANVTYSFHGVSISRTGGSSDGESA